MRIGIQQLERHLKQGLAPIYLLTGDEPLQMGESADSIRLQARRQGYSGRDILEADTRFDWGQLAAEANSLSLFAEKRILDLRIPGGKPGTTGGKALVEYTQRPAEDTLLLITLPKLERAQANSKWLKAVEKTGVVIAIWPLEGRQLPSWIEQRMRTAGFQPDSGVVEMLADRVEGNLLAARQEIDKLLLLYGPGRISPEQLTQSVADSARYDVFGLIDSAL